MRLLAALLLTLPAPTTPAPTTPAPTHPPAQRVCTITDDRAHELSGLVATANGYVAINDGQDDPDDIRLFYLDSHCAVTKTVGYPTAARDPEDLAVAPDGSLWIADTGDNATNKNHRSTVALWHVPARGGRPVLYRLSYPDGPHDAESLLIMDDGTPLLITKELFGAAELYAPTGPLQPGAGKGVPLNKLGSFTPRPTNVDNEWGTFGELMVTGAAMAPDRRRFALRTYTAAYEWDIDASTVGDVAYAITNTRPKVTDLPDEPQGEAIAYTPDGGSFVTVSDSGGPAPLLRYPAAPRPTPSPSWTLRPAASSPLTEIPWYGLAAGAAGLLLVVAGALGYILARRRRSNGSV